MDVPIVGADVQPLACAHREFSASLTVARIEEDAEGLPQAYSACVRVFCAHCGEPFHWVGVPAGLSPLRPMVDPLSLELRAPLAPGALHQRKSHIVVPTMRRPLFEVGDSGIKRG